ncbi:hypothetical protein K435DRAFT_783163 [Dendrothele bispora CBS 962.96]|uniref:Uncharacterized protein n=1 Tax=Dendrothele bispora (strain CBS 962.96) TaxID=1314807 RepID=A0A4S8LAZ0_DENBC|nr:hypothetical protein K435DRAFT_783163 [Dendrothele bispora CBS 962.96]
MDEFKYTEALEKYVDENAIYPEAERTLVRRIDRLIIPCMSTKRPWLPLQYLVPKPIHISDSELQQCVLVPVEVSTTS